MELRVLLAALTAFGVQFSINGQLHVLDQSREKNQEVLSTLRPLENLGSDPVADRLLLSTLDWIQE
jgi:hypothetical protein